MANLITPLGLNFKEASPFVSFGSFAAEDYTIEIWFSTSQSAGNLVQSGNSRLSLWLNSRGLNSGHISSKSNKWESIYGAKPNSPIVHMATTYDNASGTKTLYINGEQIKTETVGATATPLAAFGIGAWSNDPKWRFSGTMYQARVWKVVRSAAEIKLNWLTKLTGSEAGLIGYYKMDSEDANAAAGADGYPTTVKNHASASNNGTLTGFGTTNPWNKIPPSDGFFSLINNKYGYTSNGSFSALTDNNNVYTKPGEFTMTNTILGSTKVGLNNDVLVDFQTIPEKTFASIEIGIPEAGTYGYRCEYELVNGNFTSDTITTHMTKVSGGLFHGGYGYLTSTLSSNILSVDDGIEAFEVNDKLTFHVGLRNLTNIKIKMKLRVEKL